MYARVGVYTVRMVLLVGRRGRGHLARDVSCRAFFLSVIFVMPEKDTFTAARCSRRGEFRASLRDFKGNSFARLGRMCVCVGGCVEVFKLFWVMRLKANIYFSMRGNYYPNGEQRGMNYGYYQSFIYVLVPL